MKFSKLLLLTILVICAKVTEQKATVDFADLWGTVTLQAGLSDSDREDIVCVASNTKGKGTFLWFLGSTRLDNNGRVRKTDDGVYAETLSFKPELDWDGKTLTCRYIDEDQEESDAELGIKIEIHKLPASPYVVEGSPFEEGKAAKFVVETVLYPEPSKSDFKWVISGHKDQITLLPGESDSLERFSADLNNIGDNKYESQLTINPVKSEDTDKDIFLLVKTGSVGEDKRITVQFQVTSNSHTKESNRPNYNQTTSDSHQGHNTLGIGIWIILGVIFIVILICIIYFIYQKKFQKNNDSGVEERPQSGYQRTATSEKDAEEKNMP